MVKNIRRALFAIFFAIMIFFSVKNFADSETSCKVLNDGYYLGISIGYDAFSIEDKMDHPELLSYDPTLNINGVMGGIFVGYRKFFERFYNTYLGSEFFINGNSANSDYRLIFNDDTLTTDVNVISNYGFSLMPGIRINPSSMFYLRLGYNWLKIEVDQINTNPNFSALDFNDFNTLHGIKYGLGLETVFFKRLDFRFEYQFSKYNSMETHTTAVISPKDHQWVAGLVYRIS